MEHADRDPDTNDETILGDADDVDQSIEEELDEQLQKENDKE